MFIPISQSEKLDIFFALATFYEHKNESQENIESELSHLNQTLNSISMLNQDDLTELKKRAEKFEGLSKENQQNWKTIWLEKLRQRGQTKRLDENINIENILSVLKDEPKTIQRIIYLNLPNNLAKELKLLLPQINKKEKVSHKLPIEEISNVVRDKFLSNFVAFEDIYEANPIDELSYMELVEFIWMLGIRETAISCRAIKTKESLAVFLKPFNENTTKEIAMKIADLENVSAKKVILAEKLIKKLFKKDIKPEGWIKNLGLHLLALTFADRDDIAKKFTQQKFPIELGNNFVKHLEESKSEKFEDFDEIIQLANNFKENRV